MDKWALRFVIAISVFVLIFPFFLFYTLSLADKNKELEAKVESQASEIKEKDKKIEELRSIGIDLLMKNVDSEESESSDDSDYYDDYETETSGEDETYVYITDTGGRYHRSGCSSLEHSSYEVTLSEAIEAGYTPCQNCDPPTE